MSRGTMAGRLRRFSMGSAYRSAGSRTSYTCFDARSAAREAGFLQLLFLIFQPSGGFPDFPNSKSEAMTTGKSAGASGSPSSTANRFSPFDLLTMNWPATSDRKILDQFLDALSNHSLLKAIIFRSVQLSSCSHGPCSGSPFFETRPVWGLIKNTHHSAASQNDNMSRPWPSNLTHSGWRQRSSHA